MKTCFAREAICCCFGRGKIGVVWVWAATSTSTTTTSEEKGGIFMCNRAEFVEVWLGPMGVAVKTGVMLIGMMVVLRMGVVVVVGNTQPCGVVKACAL